MVGSSSLSGGGKSDMSLSAGCVVAASGNGGGGDAAMAVETVFNDEERSWRKTPMSFWKVAGAACSRVCCSVASSASRI